MKIWLDDLRMPPDESWYWAKTATEAIKLLADKAVTEISLDHDLGAPEEIVGNGYEVALWLEEQMAMGNAERIPSVISVHSANPVGVMNIRQAIKSIRTMQELKASSTNNQD